MAGSGGEGFLQIDNSAGDAPHVGCVSITNWRLEANGAFTGDKSWFKIKTPNTDDAAWLFMNVAVQDVGNVSGTDYFLYRDAGGTLGGESAIFINCRFDGVSALFGGDLHAEHPTVPIDSWQFLVGGLNGWWGTRQASSGSAGIEMFGRATAAKPMFRITYGSEANPRITITNEGKIFFGGGAASNDTVISRAAADTLELGTGDKFRPQTTGQLLGDSTHQWRVYHEVIATASLPAAAASMDGTLIIEDAGTGDRNLIIYAGGQRFRIDGGAAF